MKRNQIGFHRKHEIKQEENHEERKESLWDVSWKKDNWEFGNTLAIPDFNKASEPFDRYKNKKKE